MACTVSLRSLYTIRTSDVYFIGYMSACVYFAYRCIAIIGYLLILVMIDLVRAYSYCVCRVMELKKITLYRTVVLATTTLQ